VANAAATQSQLVPTGRVWVFFTFVALRSVLSIKNNTYQP